MPHECVSYELGALIDVDVANFNQSLSWEAFVSKSHHTCDIAPGVQHLSHPESTLLQQYKNSGVPCHHEDIAVARHQDLQHHQARTTQVGPQGVDVPSMIVCGHDAQGPVDGTSSLPGATTQWDMNTPNRHCSPMRSSPSHDHGLLFL
jgi:hypothetical protein